MPPTMTMNLSNYTFSRVQMAAMNAYRAKQIQIKPQPSRLNSSMIERIHLTKPGCGSCGK